MIKRIVSVLALLTSLQLLAQPPAADTTQSISLQQAQQMAIARNADVVNAQLDVAIAQKKIWETTAIGLPQIKGEAAFQHLFEVPAVSIAEGAPAVEFGQANSTNYSLTLSQLIFSGEYIVGLKASKTYKRFAEENYLLAQLEMKEKVANAYYSVLVMEENLKLMDSSMLLVKSSVDDMVAMARVGFVQPTDADQMKLNYAAMENQRANLARQSLFAKRILKFNIGLPLDSAVILSETLDQFLLDASFVPTDTAIFAPETSIQGKMLKTNEDLMQLSYMRTKSTYLPTVAGFYRHKGFIDEPAFNMEPKDVVGISLNWDLFTSGQRCSQVQQAKMEYTKATNMKLQSQEGLLLAVIQAESDYANAVDIYSSNKEQLELADRIFKQYLIKQKNGMASGLDVTTVQNQYIQSQTQYCNASFDVLRLKIAMDKAKGNL